VMQVRDLKTVAYKNIVPRLQRATCQLLMESKLLFVI